MDSQDPNREADALFAALNRETTPNDPAVPRQEAALAEALRRLAHDTHPNPRFKASLEAQLMKAARKGPGRDKINLRGAGLALGWIALGAALLFGLTWIIQNVLPHPAGSIPSAATATGQPTASAPPTVSATALPTDTLAAVETPAPPTPSPAAPSFTSDLYPGVEWLVPTPFPTAPGQVTVYRQDAAEAVTVESARTMAAKLGVTGGVYQVNGEASGQVIYTVANSKQRVTFINTIENFAYVGDYTTVLKSSKISLPVEQQVAAAAEFLQSHGLLDFPYTVETDSTGAGFVSFSPRLDGIPVYYNNLGYGLINVTIDAQGQVALVNYQLFKTSPVGQFPIRSAQDAWQKALSSQTVSGVEMTTAFSAPI